MASTRGCGYIFIVCVAAVTCVLFLPGTDLFQVGPRSTETAPTSSRLEYTVSTKHMDPQKAKQAERLGMGGMGARR